MSLFRRGTLVVSIALSLVLPEIALADAIGVPFKSQVPPGSWQEKSRNCGQTSYLMIDGFFNGTSPNIESIKKLDDWIEEIFGHSKRNYNGNYTSVDMLKRVALEYGNFSEEQVEIYRGGDIEILKSNLDIGNPSIIAVYTNMYSSDSDVMHFMVLTGIDDTHVYVNDPGKTLGKNNQYTIEQFKLAWSKNNYASIIFKKNGEAPEETATVETVPPQITESKPSIFQNISNFFKNLFQRDEDVQTQETETVEQENIEEQIEVPVQEEQPSIYDGVFALQSVAVQVSSEENEAAVKLTIKNTGNTTWKPHEISLNVVGGSEENTKWYVPSWKTKLRPAVIAEEVAAGASVSLTVPVSVPTDVSKPFRLQLVRQSGSQFLQVGSSFASISFQRVEKEQEIVVETTEEQSVVDENKTIIEKIKDVSNVLGDKIVDTTKKVIDTVAPFFSFGGGGGSSSSSSESNTNSGDEAVVLPEIIQDESIDDSFSVATSSVTLFGTKNDVATNIISSIASSTFSFTSTTWEAHVPLVEGRNDITLTPFADDAIQGTSITLFITRDTTAPVITSFIITEDETSTGIGISWVGTDETSSTIFYALQVNTDDAGWTDIVTSTTSTSSMFTGERPHEYAFRVQAFDELGNGSEWYESDTAISFDWPKSVIINEIAWGGTAGAPTQVRDCPKQEWMELKNTTDTAIDLSGWHIELISPDTATSSIKLAGTIEPSDYFLLARKDGIQDAVLKLPIDLVYQNKDLDDAGMTMRLLDSDGNIIDELLFLEGWPSGNPGASMQRIDSRNAWKTSEHISAQGVSNGCGVIYGSPLQPNDRLWMLEHPFEQYPQLIDDDGVLTLTADHSPYVLSGEVLIPEGKTLVVDAGVTLIGHSSKATVIIKGTLLVNGTAESPVRITSGRIASDDTWQNQFFGGGSPAPGDWSHIDVVSGGTLEMHYTEVSYGGDPFVTSNGFVYGQAQSQVIRNSGTTILDHVSLLDSYIHTNHNFVDDNAVLWMEGGHVEIANSIFDTGGIAIKNTSNASGSLSIVDTRFSHFTYPKGPIILYGIFPNLSGNNIFSENVNNSIVILSYEFTEDTTISSGAYVAFGSVTIPADVTLTVEEGGGIGIGNKGFFHIYGTLETNGTPASPVSISGWAEQWSRMIFYPGSQGNLIHTNISGGGATVSQQGRIMIDISSADVMFVHTDIAGSAYLFEMQNMGYEEIQGRPSLPPI
ncbi:MAG: hypothetical protein UW10_C0016G0027 [Candidatus Magasanikbacteria bacterium GW2011_GWA2_43_9]|nr:MAG: hypothetical protein UW10_C0016G0027 [Candidatus Magasanikbacteria bacterium GW2011_GWA2_43_9]